MPFDILIPPPDYQIKMRIAHSVDRPIDELSVADICSKAGISRQTFYKNFESKYAISRWFARLSEERYLDQIGRTLSWRDGLTMHATMLSTERSLFLRSSHNRWEASLIQKVQRHRVCTLVTTLRDYRHVEPNDALMFSVTAYTHLEEHMFMEWFAGGMTPEPETFASYLVDCVPRRLYEALAL